MIYKLMDGRRIRVVPLRGENEGTFEFETYHVTPAPEAQRVTDSVEYLSGDDAESRISALRIGNAIRFGAVYGGGPQLAHTGRPSRAPSRIAGALAVVATVGALSVVTSPDAATPTHLSDVTTAPVLTPSPTHMTPYRPTPRPSTHTTREGVRATLTAIPSTSLATPSTRPTKRHPIAKAPADIRITYYRNCTTNPQPCIDAGALTFYAGRILAGHNYMGYQWLSRVPVGRTVRVISGPMAGTYRVYGHLVIPRQGGAIPAFAGSPALVLQACEGSGTGFSLLHRI
ncbi:hypothetical protein [Streptomyces sp. NPDC005302]|uniref:hypothetical protein n=1 Tax=Streptomyces sp. NPDC005302 TaxID=3154675 RepID=UPI0033BEF618